MKTGCRVAILAGNSATREPGNRFPRGTPVAHPL